MNFSMENEKKIIDIEPKKQDIDEILNWLKEEKKHSRDSFYNNKGIIENAFEKGNSIVFKQGNKNVGLAIWHNTKEFQIDIDIFVIHPNYRGQGFGHFYYNEVLIFFRNKDFKVIKLFCCPSTSESFWKKMGFIKFPECGYTEHELTYYMVLVDTASIEYKSAKDKVELWDVDPYESENKKPKWTWYVEMKDGVLSHPIIQQCNCNWNLRWSRNGHVLREEKVKYFTNKDYELYCSSFLYIKSLKE